MIDIRVDHNLLSHWADSRAFCYHDTIGYQLDEIKQLS